MTREKIYNHIGISNKYKYVYIHEHRKSKVLTYISHVNIRVKGKKTAVRQRHKTEREAAIAVDKYLLSIGKDPVNILKPISSKGFKN